MKALLTIAVLALALIGSAAAKPPFARQPQSGEVLPTDHFAPARPATPDAAPAGLSAREAARRAQSINGGGRVLSVEDANGGWRVKLLKDGNVRIVFMQH